MLRTTVANAQRPVCGVWTTLTVDAGNRCLELIVKSLERLFSTLARSGFLYSKPLFGSMLLFLIASPFALRGLRLDTDFSRAVPPSDPLVKIYRQNRSLFGESTPLVIRLLFAGAPTRGVDRLTEELAESLRNWDDVLTVDFSPLDFQNIDESVLMLRAALLNSDPSLLPDFLSRFTDEGLRRQLARSRRNLIAVDDPVARELISADILNLREILIPFFGKSSDWPLSTNKYFDDTLGESRILLVHLSGSSDDSAYCTRLLERLELLIQDIKNKNSASSLIEHQLTGFHVLTGQSARTLEREMLSITAAATTALFLVTWLSLGNIRATVICFFPLILSMLSVLLLARLLFNPVYFLTIGFAAIVIGLGLDIGLHLTARFFRFASTSDTAEAVEKAMVECGPPIVVGMATTAAAFLSLTFAENEGLKQFGLLTSAGLILTLAVSVTAFPAVAGLFAPRKTVSEQTSLIRGAPRRFIGFGASRPKTAFAIALTLVVLASPFAARFSLDMDILHLFPGNLPAFEAARETGRAFGTSFTSVTQVTIESSSYEQAMSVQKTLDRRLARMFKQKEIASYESASNFLVYPSADDTSIRGNLTAVGAARKKFYEHLDELRIKKSPALESYYDTLEKAAEPSEWETDNPPAERLLTKRLKRYVAYEDGKYRLQTYIWPKAGGAAFDIDAHTAISHPLEQITLPAEAKLSITGTFQIYERINEIVRSDFLRVSWLGVLLVAALVLIFFRSVTETLTALVPLAAALLVTAALVVLFDVPFTPSGIAFASVIAGVGIDDSVHVIARARKLGVTQLKDVVEEIGPVIGLTTLSTMIGFGALALSSHAVVSSLGQVIMVGVMACWFFTLFLLPTVFTFLSRGNTWIRRTTLVVPLILVSSTTNAETAQRPADKVLEKLAQRQESFEAVTCEYQQKKRLKQIDGEIRVKGKIQFQKPHYLRMDLTGDENLDILCNGQKIWIVDRDSLEVEIHSLEENTKSRLARNLPFLYFFQLDEIRSHFTVTKTGDSKDGNVLELVPLPGRDFPFLRLTLELDGRDRLRRAVVEYSEEERIETTFSNWNRIEKVSVHHFEYRR